MVEIFLRHSGPILSRIPSASWDERLRGRAGGGTDLLRLSLRLIAGESLTSGLLGLVSLGGGGGTSLGLRLLGGVLGSVGGIFAGLRP